MNAQNEAMPAGTAGNGRADEAGLIGARSRRTGLARARRAALMALAAAAVGTGCTWVPLSDAGEGVRVVDETEVAGCEEIGRTTSKVADRVWIFARRRDKVREELATLARNEAAQAGGDTVAPRGPVTEGRQQFGVYRCDVR